MNAAATANRLNARKRELLAAMPQWQGAPLDEVLDLLEPETDVIDAQPSQVLVRQGEKADSVYYTVSAEVTETREKETNNGHREIIIHRTLGPGRLVGGLALFYNLAHTGTAKVTQYGQILRISTVALDRVLYRYPRLRDNMAPLARINRLRTMPYLAPVKSLVILGYLAEETQVRPLQENDIIYTDKTAPEHVYLIHRGQVCLFFPHRAGECKRLLGTGGAFGFPGSVPGRSNAANGYGHWARATCTTELYLLSWTHVKRLARFYPQLQTPTVQETPAAILREAPVFKNFTRAQREELAGYCSFQHIPQYHLLVQQGDFMDSMWILLEGGRATIRTLDSSGTALPPAPVDGLVYFGEVALVVSRNANSTIEAEPGSLWLRLHHQDFQNFVNAHPGENLREKLNVRLPEELHRPRRAYRHYPWLSPGEVLVSLNRRHWIALLRKCLLGINLLLFTVLAALLLNMFHQSLWWSLLLGIPGGLALAWGVIDYLNDYFIVTNQRIIQQEKVLFISEQRRAALLEQVENVDIRTAFWGNLLGYGTVSVSTASAAGAIDFDLVSKPASLKDEIMRERRLRQQRFAAESKTEVRNVLERRLGLVVDLPSRVRPEQPRRATTEDASLPWYRRLWNALTIDRSLQWASTERIVWRKHWFILARQVVPLFGLLLLLLLPLLGGVTLGFMQVLEGPLGRTVLSLELISGLLALIVMGVIAWITADWWNDTYELTHDRIIDVEKLPLFFGEQRREAQLSEIQDIQLQISSPLEMLLNYGDVVVRTAAQQGAFTFDHVPNPRAVKDEITRRLVEWRRQEERRRARARMRDIPDWFELYNRLEASQEAARLNPDD